MPVFRSKRARRSWIQAVRLEALEEQHSQCYYCGLFISIRPQADHVVPTSRGGTDERSNIVATCGHCGKKKKNRPIETILVRLKKGAGVMAEHDQRRRGLLPLESLTESLVSVQ
jgi:5-methylcytosine-specific restriction endonuclease McrA